jgi:alpha-galactosidase
MNKRFVYVLAMLCSVLAGSTSVFALNNGLARTPPMGFNTWNYFGCRNSSGHGAINEALMKGIADAFVSKGMADVGYQYVNLDDCYMSANRNSSGGLAVDPTLFPKGMRELTDYVHSKGLKSGLYTDVGNITCASCYGTGGFPGILNHEQQDADTFVAWGIDYVKVDFCCFSGTAVTTYAKFRDCLKAAVTRMKPTVPTAHPILFSICNWGNQNPWLWGDTVGNSWRTTNDIGNNWGSMLGNSDNSQSHYANARIGSWNDPDMLEVGYGDFATNYAQARAHFSLWCIEAAPLIAGNDVRNMNSTIQSILTNKDAIAIDQDTLSGDTTMGIIQGRRIVSGNSEVWVKLLKGKKASEYAVLFFNRNNSGAVSMSVTTQQIASVGGDIATGKIYKLRDVWGEKDLADWTAGGTYTTPATVPVHDVFMMRLSVPPVSTIPLLATVKVTDMHVQAEGERVIVRSKRSGPLTIALVNLKGETVYMQHQVGPMNCSFSTRLLPRGMYIVAVQNAMERFEQKVFLK